MITIPIYDMIILPDVTYYFKKDVLKDLGAQGAEKGDQLLFLMLKEDKSRKDMTMSDFYPIGVIGELETIDGDGNVSVKTGERVEVSDLQVTEEAIEASVSVRKVEEDIESEEIQERFEKMRSTLLHFIQGFQWGIWARSYVLHWKSMNEVVSALSGYLTLSDDEKYAILASDTVSERMERIEKAIYEFIEMARVSEEAETAQQEKHEKVYREEAIKKQIDFLQRQLDEMHPENVSDIRKFEQKLQDSGMNQDARKEADKVLNRMKQEGKDSHEYGLLYDYLDFVTSLSWKKMDAEDVDLKESEEILDREHYGLKKVKQRIVQQMAVMALKQSQSGSILLFVGAPGTGKTSIGQSIAEALRRKYVRVSLGGVRDEAEIRGHRRTYVGAMPGRIMEGMKRCGTSNPVMVLDEVDKLSRDYSGDPASALLEVLDPEQNNNFTDHYMNVPYDLSLIHI